MSVPTQLRADLIALLTHDLRRPLEQVVSYLDLQDVPAARASAEKLREVLDEVLFVCLLEEKSFPVRRTAVAIAGLVSSALADAEHIALKKRVELVSTVVGDPVASFDGRLLRRALEILIASAIRATPPASDVVVAVETTSAMLRAEVADRGPISERNAQWEQREGEVAGRVHGGFGGDLYLVARVASAHGGSVTLRERLGGGTIVRLCLPGDGART